MVLLGPRVKAEYFHPPATKPPTAAMITAPVEALSATIGLDHPAT